MFDVGAFQIFLVKGIIPNSWSLVFCFCFERSPNLPSFLNTVDLWSLERPSFALAATSKYFEFSFTNPQAGSFDCDLCRFFSHATYPTFSSTILVVSPSVDRRFTFLYPSRCGSSQCDLFIVSFSHYHPLPSFGSGFMKGIRPVLRHAAFSVPSVFP